MAHAVWDGGGELPPDDLGVLLSCGSGGGAEGVDGKVGVGGEELDEAGGGVSGGGGTGGRGGEGGLPLADCAGCAEDADLDLGAGGGGHEGFVETSVDVECTTRRGNLRVFARESVLIIRCSSSPHNIDDDRARAGQVPREERAAVPVPPPPLPRVGRVQRLVQPDRDDLGRRRHVHQAAHVRPPPRRPR